MRLLTAPNIAVICGWGILLIAILGLLTSFFGLSYPIWQQFLAAIVGMSVGTKLVFSQERSDGR